MHLTNYDSGNTSRSHSTVGNATVGVMWFAIILQLALTFGVIFTLATNTRMMHRLQISVFGAVAIVFAVTGIDRNVYSTEKSQQAMAAGWFVIAVVDILWVMYFASEEQSVMHRLVQLGSSEAAPSAQYGLALEMGGPSSRPVSGYPPSSVVGSLAVPYESKVGSTMASPGHGNGSEAGGVKFGGSVGAGPATGEGAVAQRKSVGRGSGGTLTAPGSRASGMSDLPPPREGAVASSSARQSGGSPQATPPESKRQLAEALYTCWCYWCWLFHTHLILPLDNANREDPTELTLVKGEILDIMDKSGKWWQARKADGTEGSACLDLRSPGRDETLTLFCLSCAIELHSTSLTYDSG